MIDYIISETKKAIFNCCERYAKKKEMAIENVQLVLGLKKSDDTMTETDGGIEEKIAYLNSYTICENDDLQTKSIEQTRRDELTILEVLGVRIDFLGKSVLAPPFIAKSIIRYSEKYKVEIDKLNIMCIPIREDKNKKVVLYIFNGNNYLDEIQFTDLFREEDFEMPTL